MTAPAGGIRLMQSTRRKVIVIDNFQYIMANEFMRRTSERGVDKFIGISKNAWDILNAAASLPDDTRVYVQSHVETTARGRAKIKTIGKMLNEKITLEGRMTVDPKPSTAIWLPSIKPSIPTTPPQSSQLKRSRNAQRHPGCTRRLARQPDRRCSGRAGRRAAPIGCVTGRS